MKLKILKILTIFSLFFYTNEWIFAQKSTTDLKNSSVELSNSLLAELKKLNSGEAKKIPLSTAVFENFPFNIQIEFPAKENPKQKTFVIALTQEDAWNKIDILKEFLDFAKEGEFEFDLNFILTAGDIRKISGNEKTMGTEVFCQTMEGAQNLHALLLDFRATKKTCVTPGAGKTISPLYLTRPLCSSLDEESIGYRISGDIFLSLYNLGILKSDARLSAFLSREIPAVMLSMLSEKENYESEIGAIKNFLLDVRLPESGNWSRHYIPVKFPSKIFWITEGRTLTAITIFMALCIFTLSDFEFIFRKKSRRLVKIKERALKSTYLIFVTVALITASLFLGQILITALQKSGTKNIALLFMIKTSIPFFIVSLIYPLEIKMHKNLIPYIYEYILSLSALLNVFIFTSIDISLFFLFAFEFLILAISRTAKRTTPLYFFMAIFFLPFAPLLYSILIYSDAKKISELVFCSLDKNIFMGFALVPLGLLWLRVLAQVNSKALSAKRAVAYYFVACTASIVGIAVLSLFSISALNRIFFKDVEPVRPFARVEESVGNASVSVFDSEYYGGKIRSIEISSKKIPERYAIFVQGESENPVYFSIYETSHEDGRTEFLLPENPPQNLTVTYTPDFSDNSIITIEAYFLNDNSNHAEKEIFSFEEKDGEIMQRLKLSLQ